VSSPEVASVCDLDKRNRVVKWLRGNVFPHEEFFKGSAYRHFRCFGEWTNTVIEGTNSGLKRKSSFAVRPDMPMDVSVKNIILQDKEKAAKLYARASSEVESCSTAHASHPLSRSICDCALSEVLVQVDESKKYVSVQSHPNRWLVYRGASRTKPKLGRPQPLYVRVVTVTGNQRMVCSCGHYQQNGLPCRHLIHVIAGHFDRELSVEDFEPRLWRNYAHIMVVHDPKTDDEKDLRNVGRASLCHNDGPLVLKETRSGFLF